jgi:hypothetical protein
MPEFDLVYLVLRFRLTPRDSAAIDELTGPAVRGALGNRLRRLSCLTAQPTCDRCDHQSWCPYFSLFEASPATHAAPYQLRGVQSAPHPYVIRAPYLDRDEIVLGITVIGDAMAHVPLVIQAVRAMGEGCTRRNVQFTVTAVECRNALREWRRVDRPHSQDTPVAFRLSDVTRDLAGRHVDRVRCDFLSPMELQDGGQLQGGVLPGVLVRRLVQRVEALATLYCGADLPQEQRDAWIEAGDQLILEHHDIWWERQWSRSSRQGRDVPGGLLRGTIQLAGPLDGLAPLFAMAPDIGVGKKTTRGGGECEVTFALGPAPAAMPQ